MFPDHIQQRQFVFQRGLLQCFRILLVQQRQQFLQTLAHLLLRFFPLRVQPRNIFFPFALRLFLRVLVLLDLLQHLLALCLELPASDVVQIRFFLEQLYLFFFIFRVFFFFLRLFFLAPEIQFRQFIRRRESRPNRLVPAYRHDGVAFLVAVDALQHPDRDERLVRCARIARCARLRVRIHRKTLDFLLSAQFRKLPPRFGIVRSDKQFYIAVRFENIRYIPAVLCRELRETLQYEQEPYPARARHRYHALHVLELREISPLIHDIVHVPFEDRRFRLLPAAVQVRLFHKLLIHLRYEQRHKPVPRKPLVRHDDEHRVRILVHVQNIQLVLARQRQYPVVRKLLHIRIDFG